MILSRVLFPLIGALLTCAPAPAVSAGGSLPIDSLQRLEPLLEIMMLEVAKTPDRVAERTRQLLTKRQQEFAKTNLPVERLKRFEQCEIREVYRGDLTNYGFAIDAIITGHVKTTVRNVDESLNLYKLVDLYLTPPDVQILQERGWQFIQFEIVRDLVAIRGVGGESPSPMLDAFYRETYIPEVSEVLVIPRPSAPADIAALKSIRSRAAKFIDVATAVMRTMNRKADSLYDELEANRCK